MNELHIEAEGFIKIRSTPHVKYWVSLTSLIKLFKDDSITNFEDLRDLVLSLENDDKYRERPKTNMEGYF